jgi:hypothetical protein
MTDPPETCKEGYGPKKGCFASDVADKITLETKNFWHDYQK